MNETLPPDMDETPDTPVVNESARQVGLQAGLDRRSVIKKAAGVGILMSTLAHGSALAAPMCKQFSNWMSGSRAGGSVAPQSPITCNGGRSISFWSNGVKVEDDVIKGVTEEIVAIYPGIVTVYNKTFYTIFPYPGSPMKPFGLVLHSGTDINKAFAAAYFNAQYVGDYPLKANDLKTLFLDMKSGKSGFTEANISAYLKSTFSS